MRAGIRTCAPAFGSTVSARAASRSARHPPAPPPSVVAAAQAKAAEAADGDKKKRKKQFWTFGGKKWEPWPFRVARQRETDAHLPLKVWMGVCRTVYKRTMTARRAVREELLALGKQVGVKELSDRQRRALEILYSPLPPVPDDLTPPEREREARIAQNYRDELIKVIGRERHKFLRKWLAKREALNSLPARLRQAAEAEDPTPPLALAVWSEAAPPKEWFTFKEEEVTLDIRLDEGAAGAGEPLAVRFRDDEELDEAALTVQRNKLRRIALGEVDEDEDLFEKAKKEGKKKPGKAAAKRKPGKK